MKISSFILRRIGPVAAVRPLQNESADDFAVNRPYAKIFRLRIGGNQFIFRQPLVRLDTISLLPPPSQNLTHHSDCFFNLIEVDLYLTHKTPKISRRKRLGDFFRLEETASLNT